MGQWAQSGATLARLVEPGKLKAVLRIPETQAKDVAIGQPAAIDTRNGIVKGKVYRIDPAVQNGTVTVDVSLEGELPRGARPDLSVDGTIQVERLENVLHVGRPAYGQANSAVGLFKLAPDGTRGRAGERPAGPYLGQHGRDPRRSAAGREGHHLGHVPVGWIRPGEGELMRRSGAMSYEVKARSMLDSRT